MSNRLYIVANSYSNISPGVYSYSNLIDALALKDKIIASATEHGNKARVSITEITHFNTAYPSETKIYDSFEYDLNGEEKVS